MSASYRRLLPLPVHSVTTFVTSRLAERRLAMGVVTTLAEASTSIADALNWYDRVGPLSGKTIVAVAVWLVAWAVLHMTLRRKAYETTHALIVSLILIALGVIGTFPTFFQAFASD